MSQATMPIGKKRQFFRWQEGMDNGIEIIKYWQIWNEKLARIPIFPNDVQGGTRTVKKTKKSVRTQILIKKVYILYIREVENQVLNNPIESP